MARPVIRSSTVTPGTIIEGGQADWMVDAYDPDGRTVTMRRPVTDAAGNVATAETTLTIGGELTYGTPTSDDPAVTFVVDSADPRLVHVQVAPLAD